MTTLPVGLAPSSPRSSLLAAYNEWSHANFSGCLEELDRIARTISGIELLEARLLRARVYARLDRPLDAVRELRLPDAAAQDDFDVLCSVKSVRGHSLSLAGLHDEAIADLRQAVADSGRHVVRRSVRLEALYMLAFAHWLAEDYDAADAVLRTQAIQPNGDIIAARAIALRAWIAVGRTQYAQALELFREALRVYASVSSHDAGFAASTLHAVAMYELELLQHGDHPRYYYGDFPTASTTALDTFRLLVHDIDAWRAALAGDEYQAIESSIRIQSLRVSPHWAVFGTATRAMIAEAFGHTSFSRAFATAGAADAQRSRLERIACQVANRVALSCRGAGESRRGPRSESVAMFSGIRTKVLPRFFGGKGRLQCATEEFSRGVVACRAENRAAARAHLRTAQQAFAEMGFLRNATAAQLLLGEEQSAEGEQHYRAARVVILERFPRSYLARRLLTIRRCCAATSGGCSPLLSCIS